MILIKNGKIITVTKGTLKNGCILIKDGKILKVSEDIEVNEDVRIIDAKGGWVTPGFIDAHCRSEEHTSELQSRQYIVCRLLLEKKTNATWNSNVMFRIKNANYEQ